MSLFALTALILILARAMAELWLSRLNQNHVQAHANEVPQGFRQIIDEVTYRRSVSYTLARGRFGDVVAAFDTALLMAILFSGVLPWAFGKFTAAFGASIWAMSGFLFTIGLAASIVSLPFAWYAQFKLEDRFGFNTTTLETWFLDRLKGFLLAALLGYPLLALVLKLIEWTGPNWWISAAAVVVGFRFLLLWIAPAAILPLFNKFTPLPEGSTLRERLLALTLRTAFPARSIELMDGSRRSRHSNAFFTGFGRFRKIVLFDTLVTQLSEPEVESVVAHEIGHHKKRHVLKSLSLSIIAVFTGFGAVAWLARRESFYRAFGFEYQPGFAAPNVVPAMLLFALLAGTISFWFSPLIHMWSRHFEYEADAFASVVVGRAQPLVQALRKLTEKNLSNLTPHPLYSRFYYSHPTLAERERALEDAG